MKRNSALTIKIGSLLASSLLFGSFLTNASLVNNQLVAPGSSKLNILTPPKYVSDGEYNFNYSSYKDYQSILKDLYLQYESLYSMGQSYKTVDGETNFSGIYPKYSNAVKKTSKDLAIVQFYNANKLIVDEYLKYYGQNQKHTSSTDIAQKIQLIDSQIDDLMFTAVTTDNLKNSTINDKHWTSLYFDTAEEDTAPTEKQAFKNDLLGFAKSTTGINNYIPGVYTTAQLADFYASFDTTINSYFSSTNLTYNNQNFLQDNTHNLLYSMATSPAEYSFNFMFNKISELRDSLKQEFNPYDVIQNPLSNNLETWNNLIAFPSLYPRFLQLLDETFSEGKMNAVQHKALFIYITRNISKIIAVKEFEYIGEGEEIFAEIWTGQKMYPDLSNVSDKELFSILETILSSNQRDMKIDVVYNSGLNLKAAYYPELVGSYYKDLMSTSAATLAQEALEQAAVVYGQYASLFTEYQQFINNSGNLENSIEAGIDYVDYEALAVAAGYAHKEELLKLYAYIEDIYWHWTGTDSFLNLKTHPFK